MRKPDDDLPQEQDLDRFGDESALCPKCNQTYYDDLIECPHCGAAPAGSGLPTWAVVTAAVLLVLLVGGVLAALLAPR